MILIQTRKRHLQNGLMHVEAVMALAITLIALTGTASYFVHHNRERVSYLASAEVSEKMSRKLEELLNVAWEDPSLEETNCNGCVPKSDASGKLQWEVTAITPQLKQISIRSPGTLISVTGFRFNDF